MMQAANFRLGDYFTRIGYTGSVAPTLDVLHAVMACQLRSIPFENLDVQAKKPISIVPEEIVSKILPTTRGGYCYELNSIFAMALQAIGFQHQLLGARTMVYATRRARTHMVLLVTVAGKRYLCDTGFGNYGIRAPLYLDMLNAPQQQGYDTFQITQDEQGDYIMQALVGGQWVSQYGFNLSRFELIDFIPANYFNSTHPDALFVQKRVVLKFTETGRVILVGDTLKTYDQGAVAERTLSHAEVQHVITHLFGITI